MKRNLRQKVRGYTVMELMVVMVVSGIVVLSALQFYIIFNKLIYKENNAMDGVKEVLQFYGTLKNDMDSSISVHAAKDGVAMKMSEKNLIQYDFFDQYVTRTQNMLCDTFRLKVMDLKTQKDLTTGFDHIIALEIQKDKETYSVLLEKTYSDDVLLNTTISQKMDLDGN